MNAHAMVAEDGNIRGDRDLLRQVSVSAHVELRHVRVLSRLKAEIPDLHEFPLFGRSRIASIIASIYDR